MPSPEIVDFDTLLKPIAGDNPAGVSVRYDGVYDAIQEARRSEDDLPMGEWEREVKAADWRSAINLSTDAISNKSKDLQIGAWLTEALLKQHGFAGLRDGLRLLRELQEKFWDGIFPESEDGDLEFRAGPLNWINEKLPSGIRQITLTEGDQSYAWSHWDESRTVDNLGRQNPDAMQAAIAEGKINGEQFDKAVEESQRAFYERLFEDLNQTKAELSQLEKTTDEKFGPSAPSLMKIRGAIDECHQLIGSIVKKKREQDPNYRAESEGDTGSTDGALGASDMGHSGVGSWSGEPRSREEAFQRLAVLAAYLKRVEPQHPVSYLLDRAVRWTHMPLEEWLNEVVQNDEVLNRLRDTLGIKGWGDT
jgi:type VI secretion system protein ImpA